ncbi:MAG: glycoside hydrolase family 127 protein [Planctomycetes bacterium]|nr:glycoside hydrolase family 127 protein [Planctomycetota bacterium]
MGGNAGRRRLRTTLPGRVLLAVLVGCAAAAWPAAAVRAETAPALPPGAAPAPALPPQGGAAPTAPRLLEVPFTAVEVRDAFWSPRMETNRRATIPHLIAMCELEGRVRNFRRAAGELPGPFEGTRRHDADLYKVIEAASYVLASRPQDADVLRRRLDGLVDAIVAAQRPDGYLDTFRTVGRPDQRPRTQFEMFAAGHLLDAGVAFREATGDRRLLDAACRYADLLAETFGQAGRRDVPAHPKIEASLVRLGRATGERRYMDLARFFLDERGRAGAAGRESYGLHRLDVQPVRDLADAEGHVICALFLLEGMYDVAVETGDAALLDACRRVYHDAVSRRMYVTGAMGRAWDERFTDPWALENRTSIGEGCQSAALARLAHRLLLHEADARHADVLERVLYNNLPANVGLDGRTFYYVNRLSARAADATGRPYVYPLVETAQEHLPRFCLDRQPWFKVPCCPPNVAMTLAPLGRFIYARSADAVYVNLYVGTEAAIPVAGTTVRLVQETRYPWEGRVRLTIAPAEPRAFTLGLRIPDWCRDLESAGGLYRFRPDGEPVRATVLVNGRAAGAGEPEKGYVRLRRTWRAGDAVDLDLPMAVRRVVSDPRVAANAGRVALVRGPLVYCVEAADHGGRVADLRLPAGAAPAAEHRPDLLGGITVIKCPAERADAAAGAIPAAPLLAVPYGVWANRQVGEMDVWLPEGPPGPRAADPRRSSAAGLPESRASAPCLAQREARGYDLPLGIARFTGWMFR